MNEYTAEDFKNARFAIFERPGGECRAVAHSSRADAEDRWIIDCSHLKYSNAEMAEIGWTPVGESSQLDRIEALLERIAENTTPPEVTVKFQDPAALSIEAVRQASREFSKHLVATR